MPNKTPGATSKVRAHSSKNATILEVLGQFRSIFSSVRRDYNDIQAKTGLSGAQLWALSLIAEHQGMTVGELAKSLSIHQSTASNLIRDLTRLKAISKVRLKDDLRTVQLQVTSKGRNALDRAPGPWAGVLQEQLMKLSGRELNELQLNMEKLTAVGGAVQRRVKRTPLPEL